METADIFIVSISILVTSPSGHKQMPPPFRLSKKRKEKKTPLITQVLKDKNNRYKSRSITPLTQVNQKNIVKRIKVSKE